MDTLRNSLKRGLLLFCVLLALCTFAAATANAESAVPTAATPAELYTIMFDNMKTHTTEFAVNYTGPTDILYDVNSDSDDVSAAILTRGMAASIPNPDGTGADIYMMNISWADCSLEDSLLTFHVNYLLDQQQLAWVEGQVDSILDTLQLEDASDYVKIKKIYQYMGTNFTYDKTLTKFTDYEGLTTGSMVCQGYALLTYKLLWKAGVPCRIVVGVSNGENHGWNIVRLNDKWYNLDTTWDAADDGLNMYWTYFLKSEADFTGHTRDDRFATEEFFAAYPMAEESYSVPSIDILIDGVLYSGLTIRNGRTTQLEARLTPETDLPVIWKTSDESIVSITEDGLIESLVPGKVYITAAVSDPAYIEGVFPVTAVDLRTCSPWADEELNSYYLRKLYPAELCSDYQTAITREEFAQLLYLLMGTYAPTGGQMHYPGFEDVINSPYWFGIVYTSSRGLFQGTGEKTFSPSMTLTREQAAKVICSMLDFLEIPLASGEAKTFTDAADVSPWATEYVARASAAGLLLGDGETFRPKDVITREEAAVTLERIFLKYIEPNRTTTES